ncbi:hypothetical protein GCK72_012433 [Caenorhabditis remanei]|uniref:T-box domain-containing protein n=1 Tax=Caenorhabditis remanei TaxID=31234 RepID=A0A6A5GL06_CAERE|nr:hypothetical protein GCK72_012433 [Caenorhabditis remanei]KAF1755980.1 hypothetical protein GCK72_012433 [Caenorhabditis remanei]
MYPNPFPQYPSEGLTDQMRMNQHVMWNNGQYGYPQNAFLNTQPHAVSHHWSQQGPAHEFQRPQLPPQPQTVIDNSDNIRVTLKDEKEWKELHKLRNEMLVLSVGRMLFPQLNYLVTGLNTHENYTFGLKLKRLNSNILKRNEGGWEESKIKVKASWESNEIFSDTCKGSVWMEQGVFFKTAKIYSEKKRTRIVTETEEKRQEGLLINTRCRYIPVLSIYSQESEIASRQFPKSFEIEVTQFVAVTCVKNTAVVNWKTAKNKFARVDFKENLMKNRKRDFKESEDNSGISLADNTMTSSHSPIVAKEDSECYQATVSTMGVPQSNGNSNLESLLTHGPSTSTVAHYAPNFLNYNVTPGVPTFAFSSATVSNGAPQYSMNDCRPLDQASMATNNLLIPCQSQPIPCRAVHHNMEQVEHQGILTRPTGPSNKSSWDNNNMTLDFTQNSNYQF